MSFQMIRGGKSFGIALEMLEYFKSGDINRGTCFDKKNNRKVAFTYFPAGTNHRHFLEVARALCGNLCGVRAHDVERDVPEINHRNRRHVEFYIEHEPRDFEPHELITVHFKLTLIQYGDAGIWGFLGAELTEVTVGGKRTITRYAMRESIPEKHRPHLIPSRRLIFPGMQNWSILGMEYPLYVVSQEISGEDVKTPTNLELMKEMAGDD